jgi:hypothetical protein
MPSDKSFCLAIGTLSLILFFKKIFIAHLYIYLVPSILLYSVAFTKPTILHLFNWILYNLLNFIFRFLQPIFIYFTFFFIFSFFSITFKIFFYDPLKLKKKLKSTWITSDHNDRENIENLKKQY